MVTQNSVPVSSTLASCKFSSTAEDFGHIRDLIYRHIDISLPDRKSEMVYSRLARRLHVVSFDSFRDYLDVLERDHLPDEWEAFASVLIINLTTFFREQHHSPILHEHAKAKRTPFTVWYSASSTGEEPYPIAITLAEIFGSMSPGRASMITSDVDTNALARVRASIYPMGRIAALSPERLEKYSLHGTDKQEGYARVQPELQAMIDFRQINLLERDRPLQQKFDVIFCRNVVVYFDKPTQVKTLEHFISVMKPDDLLFAGHSESFLQIIKA